MWQRDEVGCTEVCLLQTPAVMEMHQLLLILLGSMCGAFVVCQGVEVLFMCFLATLFLGVSQSVCE